MFRGVAQVLMVKPLAKRAHRGRCSEPQPQDRRTTDDGRHDDAAEPSGEDT